MNLKPISMKPPLGFASTNEFLSENSEQKNEQFDLIDGTLTVRENEEFFINCVVDSSKPAADITFNAAAVSPNENKLIDFFSTSTLTSLLKRSSSLASLISHNTNVFKNNDRTLKTVYSARLKANLKDHGKVITCKADNGFSNQKWENKKVLNILCTFFN